jgi:hypothetical protein
MADKLNSAQAADLCSSPNHHLLQLNKKQPSLQAARDGTLECIMHLDVAISLVRTAAGYSLV